MSLELAKQIANSDDFESPCFVFSKEKIIHNYHQYKILFPKSRICYAMKANFEPEILKTLVKEGAGFEVASAFEYRMVKEQGVDPKKIIYGTAVKPQSHIDELHDDGVELYAFDSQPEIVKLAAAAPGASVYVRIKVDDNGSTFKFSEKFGAEPTDAVRLLIQAQQHNLNPVGISFHVGSQATNPKAWSNAINTVIPLMNELLEHDIKLEFINIGGGYPIQYSGDVITPSLEDIANSVYKTLKSAPYEVELMLEPGRGMIASAGIAIATVIARVQRSTSAWLFLDLGVYNGLFETMAYQGSTRYKVSPIDHSFDAGMQRFALAGPTGDSPDVITREVLLPADITVGDQVVIHDAGAYSLPACSPFNGFPKPRVYLV